MKRYVMIAALAPWGYRPCYRPWGFYRAAPLVVIAVEPLSDGVHPAGSSAT
jgi:hypothetical protein